MSKIEYYDRRRLFSHGGPSSGRAPRERPFYTVCLLLPGLWVEQPIHRQSDTTKSQELRISEQMLLRHRPMPLRCSVDPNISRQLCFCMRNQDYGRGN